MDDIEVDFELVIFVLECMVAMGGLNKYLLYPVIDKGLDVLFRQLLEQFFIARLPDALPAAVLLGAEDAEIDACLIEYPGGRLGYLFEPRVIAAIAVREIEDLHPFLKCLYIESLCPGCSRGAVLAEGVALGGEA